MLFCCPVIQKETWGGDLLIKCLVSAPEMKEQCTVVQTFVVKAKYDHQLIVLLKEFYTVLEYSTNTRNQKDRLFGKTRMKQVVWVIVRMTGMEHLGE